jgi:hypothetical protein
MLGGSENRLGLFAAMSSCHTLHVVRSLKESALGIMVCRIAVTKPRIKLEIADCIDPYHHVRSTKDSGLVFSIYKSVVPAILSRI